MWSEELHPEPAPSASPAPSLSHQHHVPLLPQRRLRPRRQEFRLFLCSSSPEPPQFQRCLVSPRCCRGEPRCCRGEPRSGLLQQQEPGRLQARRSCWTAPSSEVRIRRRRSRRGVRLQERWLWLQGWGGVQATHHHARHHQRAAAPAALPATRCRRTRGEAPRDGADQDPQQQVCFFHRQGERSALPARLRAPRSS